MTAFKKPSPSSKGFPKDQRIRKTWLFKFVFENGLRVKSPHFNLWVYFDHQGQFPGKGPKLGLVVGKKVSTKANVRNLWKRRMRERFRLEKARLKPEGVYLLQARSEGKAPNSLKIAEELRCLFHETESYRR